MHIIIILYNIFYGMTVTFNRNIKNNMTKHNK